MARRQPASGLPGRLPRSFFTHHDSHPVVLGMALMRLFGVDWLIWEPGVIRHEINRITGSYPSEHNAQKIQAVRALHVTDDPWEEWGVFEKVVQALNNNLPDFFVVQGATTAQLWAALDMIEKIKEDEFEDEVQRYIAACLRHAEVWYCPGPLSIAQEFVAEPRYRCQDCGNTGEAGEGWSGHCDRCSETYTGSRTFDFKPEREATNVDVFLKRDFHPVQARWDKVDGIPIEDVKLGNNMVDNQVAKLLVARDYVSMRNTQLVEQMAWLE